MTSAIPKGRSQGPPVPAGAPGKRARRALVLIVLALLPLVTFGPRLGKVFIAYDDDEYVALNSGIQGGLTWAGVRWALTTGHASNWHPLTWISHMADVSLFGMNPLAHHATNLFLHVLNTLLLFLVLSRATATTWRSAWVAALFAIHPAHVESVAWASERKDLLSTAFGLAAILAYVSWVGKRSAGRYAALLCLFAASLMSKAMFVSLPFVLLLLDYWPLRRFLRGEDASLASGPAPGGTAAVVLEKAPLLLMAAASSAVTVLVQRAGGAVQSLETFSLPSRLGNAIVAYAGYLRMLFWPKDLGVFYPHRGASLSAGEVLSAGLLLLLLSAGAFALRRAAPYLIVGWAWFLITLFPVIGVVQVGLQAMADRYTYFPFVGPFIAVAWGATALASRSAFGRAALKACAVAVVAAVFVLAAKQAGYWKDSETLFLHTIAVTKDNTLVRNNLGDYFNRVGRAADALPILTEAVRIKPKDYKGRVNLGVSLFYLGRIEEADREFTEALRLYPDDAGALIDLARTRFVQGEIRESIRLYGRALTSAPDSVEIHKRLAFALLMEGKTAAALSHYRRVVVLDPSDKASPEVLKALPVFERNPEDPSLGPFRWMLADAHMKAAAALYGRGKKADAAERIHRALELSPSFAEAHNELGTELVGDGRLDEAAAEFQRALSIDPGLALAHNNLGYVFFLKGGRAEAIAQYLEALRLQPEFPLARSNLEQAMRQPNGK